MSLLSSLSETLDVRGSTGFTIWITPNKWLQVNICSRAGGWSCQSFKTLKEAVEFIDKWNETEAKITGTTFPRVPKEVVVKKRRDVSDLV